VKGQREMLTVILTLTIANTILQAIAVWQRHQTLELQKRNGGAA
jgi:hypothetical protein